MTGANASVAPVAADKVLDETGCHRGDLIGEAIALGDFGVGQVPTIARESESGSDFGVRPLRMKQVARKRPVRRLREPLGNVGHHRVRRSPDLISQVQIPLERRPLEDRSNCHYQFPSTLIKVQIFDCFGNHEGANCTEHSRLINRGD